MMKIYLFMMLFITSMFLISCSDETQDSYTPNEILSNKRDYVFAYKTDPDNISLTRAASLNGKIWTKGQTIRIKFLNGNIAIQNKVKEVASKWLEYANLKFQYVSTSEDADVKIAFAWNGDQVTWSTIGTDCKSVSQDTPSMNLMIFNENDSKEVNSEDFSACILREFGHILGLVYENQGPNSSFKWNEARVKNYFRQQGWTQIQIDGLIQIYSTAQTNYTEFDGESIMLLFFPNFLTTDNKDSKYNTQLSEVDKEFISSIYPGSLELPNKLELTYKQAGDNNAYPYTAIRIGEYYWVDNNFYHQAPYQGGSIYNPGGEKYTPITTEMLDTYMIAIHLNLNNKNKSGFPNQVYNLDNYARYYGQYYNRESINYMSNYGKMYQGSIVSPNWELPSYVDYRQLFAMCPIVYYNNGTLSRYDIQIALAAKHGDNPATSSYYYEVHDDKLIPGGKPEYADLCMKNNGGKAAIHAVYFNTQTDGVAYPNTNMYGFNMMAGGARGNGSFSWTNSLFDMVSGNKYHNGVDQYIRQLFYAASFYTKEANISIDDDIKTNNAYSYHWFNARWCRRLTDAELGYKLYINTSKTDIKKLDLTDAVPTGYAELPKGYLRGFYVQYILDNPSPKYTITDIVRFADNVDDPTK